MENIGAVIIVIILLLGLLSPLIGVVIQIVNESKYDAYVDELKSSGCKITYYNRTTGTIRYRDKNKRIHSESRYRGYRSHWRG